MNLLEQIQAAQIAPEPNPELETLLSDAKEKVEEALKCKVIAFAIPVGPDDNALLFLRPVMPVVKRRVIDKMMVSMMDAGYMLLQSCAIKEHSDKRIFDEIPENGDLIASACTQVLSEIKIHTGAIKKK